MHITVSFLFKANKVILREGDWRFHCLSMFNSREVLWDFEKIAVGNLNVVERI